MLVEAFFWRAFGRAHVFWTVLFPYFYRKYFLWSFKDRNFLQICEMKVAIFNSGLGVSVHEIANISGTMQDMKISKLALCRGRLGLFFHIKILVNTCWPKVRKYRLKVKSSFKTWVNLWEVQNDGGFLPHEFSDHNMVSKTLPRDVFSPTITHMKIFEKFMKKLFFEILAFFQFWVIFMYIFFTKLCTKMK